jgi:hypothetical protein
MEVFDDLSFHSDASKRAIEIPYVHSLVCSPRASPGRMCAISPSQAGMCAGDVRHRPANGNPLVGGLAVAGLTRCR